MLYPLVPDLLERTIPQVRDDVPISIPIDSESKLALTAGGWLNLALFWPSWVSLKMGIAQTNGYPMGNVMVIFHGIYKQEYGIWDEFENG